MLEKIVAAVLLFVLGAVGLEGGTPLPAACENARLVVYKEARILQFLDGDTLLREYAIGLGGNPLGTKRREGDGRTPEGEYYVCVKNGQSRFHLSFGLSYPNVEDARRGLEEGLIDEVVFAAIVEAIQKGERPPWGTALGGEICIHGHGGGRDWTEGCIAIENWQMDELWPLISLGCPVTIYP